MHPSWRDMVIEFLISSDGARCNFLEKSGVHGLMLAFSGGGGSKGLRKFPLLVEAADWRLLEQSIGRVIHASSVFELDTILNGVLEALTREFVAEGVGKLARPPLAGVAEHALTACRTKWSGAEWSIKPRHLRLYYRISEFLSPLPPSPNLMDSWQECWDRAKEEIQAFAEYDVQPVTSDIDEWLEFSVVILQFEPRFARQVRLPEGYQKMVSDLLPSLRERVQWELELDDTDECDDERGRQHDFQKIAEKVQVVFEDLGEVAEEIVNSAENRMDAVLECKARIEEEADERAEEYVIDDEGEEASNEEKQEVELGEKAAKTVFLTRPPSAELPINQLFEDL
jgi:hypothetical protein